MKIYPPEEGLTKKELQNGQWSLYADVRCTNLLCGKEFAVSNVGGIGGPCKRCGSPCL